MPASLLPFELALAWALVLALLLAVLVRKPGMRVGDLDLLLPTGLVRFVKAAKRTRMRKRRRQKSNSFKMRVSKSAACSPQEAGGTRREPRPWSWLRSPGPSALGPRP